MQLVALGSFKDDEWLVDRWLQRTAEFADAIIALDDASSDRTAEILQAHPKVVQVIRLSPGHAFSIVSNINLLLKATAALQPEWMMYIDSDEIIDRRFVERKQELLSVPDVARYHFQEITLWRSSQYYRVDRPDQYARASTASPILIRYNPRLTLTRPDRGYWKAVLQGLVQHPRKFFSPVYMPESLAWRNLEGRHVNLDLVKLHYHFVNWERVWKRHMTYAVLYAFQYHKKPSQVEEIVDWATKRLDETGLELAPVKPEWGVL